MLDKYLTKLQQIYFHPLVYLEKYKKIKGYEEPIRFLIISLLLATICNLIIDTVVFGVTTALISSSFLFVRYLLFILGTSAVFYGIIYVLGGRKPFYQTLKAWSYMSCFLIVSVLIDFLSTFVGIFSIMSLILGLWVITLITSCMKHYNDLTGIKNFLVWVIYIIITGLFWLVLGVTLVSLYPSL